MDLPIQLLVYECMQYRYFEPPRKSKNTTDVKIVSPGFLKASSVRSPSEAGHRPIHRFLTGQATGARIGLYDYGGEMEI